MSACCTHGIQKVVSELGRAVENVEGFDKLAKLVFPVTQVIQKIAEAAFSFLESHYDEFANFKVTLAVLSFAKETSAAVGSSFKEVADFLGALAIISNFSRLINKTVDYCAMDWWKLVFIVGANSCDTLKFFHAVNLINLGRLASKTYSFSVFSYIPGVGTAKDILIGSATIMGLIANTRIINDPDLKEIGEIANLKHQKWKLRQQLFENLIGQSNADDLKNHWIGTKLELGSHDNELIHSFKNKRVTGCKDIHRLRELDLDKKLTDQFNSLNLNDEEELEAVRDHLAWKVETWQKLRKINRRELKKARYSIVTDLFKLAIISLSLMTLVVSATTLSPGFILIGLPLGYCGYRKFCFDGKDPLKLPPRL